MNNDHSQFNNNKNNNNNNKRKKYYYKRNYRQHNQFNSLNNQTFNPYNNSLQSDNHFFNPYNNQTCNPYNNQQYPLQPFNFVGVPVGNQPRIPSGCSVEPVTNQNHNLNYNFTNPTNFNPTNFNPTNLNPITSTNPTNLNPITFNPITSTNPINPINPITSTNPINPINPIIPTNLNDESSKSSKSRDSKNSHIKSESKTKSKNSNVPLTFEKIIMDLMLDSLNENKPKNLDEEQKLNDNNEFTIKKDIEYQELEQKTNTLLDLINLGKTYKPEDKDKYAFNFEGLHLIVEPLEELNNMIGMDNVKKIIII